MEKKASGRDARAREDRPGGCLIHGPRTALATHSGSDGHPKAGKRNRLSRGFCASLLSLLGALISQY